MPFVSVALFVFVLYCVLDVALSESDEIRNFPKLVWLVLVVLLPAIGGITWLIAGRPPRSGRAPGGGVTSFGSTSPPRGSPGAGPRRPQPPRGGRPRGPDDDPEFLRKLGDQLRRDEDD